MAPAGCCCSCCCCCGGAVAAADAARRVLVLLLLGVLSVGQLPGALATEHYSPLSLLKQELQHRQQQEAQAGGGCSPQSGDWGEQYSVECESSFLNFHDSDCEPKGPPPCDSLLSLNTEKILSQAKSIAEQKKFPFATDNDSTNEELAIAYVLIGSGLYDEAIRHFSTMLQILSPLGRINEAVNDLTKAIQLQPSARLYRHRGTLYFISEDYATAHEDFQQSLELNKNQPIAMLYKGLTFFHRGLLKEAIESFKEALKQKVDFIDAYKSLGQAYRELGNFEAATESFQKALLLNQNHVQTLQLRGMMLYHHGSLQEALKNFKRCLQLEPYNEVCQYMKGLSHVAMGQFYEGIKAQTKVMLNDPLPGQKASPEYLKVKYLREYSRYLHAHLDTPLAEYNIDVDLPGSFKDHWAKMLAVKMTFFFFFVRHLETYLWISSLPGTWGAQSVKRPTSAQVMISQFVSSSPILGSQFNTKTKDGFTVNTKVPSLKDQGKEYDGFTITITGDKVGNILFSVETQTTEERTQLYHAEIDALYKDLTAKGKVLILSSEFGEADAVCNLILSLVYYFYNLMPLSRGSSVIAYSVIVGALMASGKEVAGKIPKGKLVDFEAMTAPGSEAFSKIAKSWMNLKSISPSYKSLPSVSETFPTLRSMIEVLNTDSSPRCLKKL
uniref:Tetratricopeptide repeat domain 13 n=1 Tax=Suricata suricatta TaxID=37032 RepID=A0A673SYE9_SURSU